MNVISAISNGHCDAIVDALRAEFGAVLAQRILDAEAADFLWDARLKERYLGQHFDVGIGSEDGVEELARVAILSFLGGHWHVGSCLVDGDGRPVDLLWKQTFDGQDEAEAAFTRAA